MGFWFALLLAAKQVDLKFSPEGEGFNPILWSKAYRYIPFFLVKTAKGKYNNQRSVLQRSVWKLAFQISQSSLVSENLQLREECAKLREENTYLRNTLSKLGIAELLPAIPVPVDTSRSKDPASPSPNTQQISSGIASSITKHSSPNEKILLFQSLFRGRPDVYARQWKGKGEKPSYIPPAGTNGFAVFAGSLNWSVPPASMRIISHLIYKPLTSTCAEKPWLACIHCFL